MQSSKYIHYRLAGWFKAFEVTKTLVAKACLVVLGSTILYRVASFAEFYQTEAKIVPIILVCSGSFGLAIYLLSLVNNSLVERSLIAAAMLVLSNLLQIAGGIFTFFYRKYYDTKVAEKMENLMQLSQGEQEYAKSAWDKLQSTLHCCGIDSFSDWQNISLVSNKIPDSCKCNFSEENCNELGNYSTGCFEKLAPGLATMFTLLGGIALGVTLFNVIISVIIGAIQKKRRR